MSVGEIRTAYDVSTHCGVRVLSRRIAATSWVAVDLDAEGVAPMPESWSDAASENERIDLVVTLVNAEELRATAVGTDTTLTYAPNVDGSTCD